MKSRPRCLCIKQVVPLQDRPEEGAHWRVCQHREYQDPVQRHRQGVHRQRHPAYLACRQARTTGPCHAGSGDWQRMRSRCAWQQRLSVSCLLRPCPLVQTCCLQLKSFVSRRNAERDRANRQAMMYKVLPGLTNLPPPPGPVLTQRCAPPNACVRARLSQYIPDASSAVLGLLKQAAERARKRSTSGSGEPAERAAAAKKVWRRACAGRWPQRRPCLLTHSMCVLYDTGVNLCRGACWTVWGLVGSRSRC